MSLSQVRLRAPLLAVLALLLAPLPARAAAEVLAGPLSARVLAVLDGDTLEVAAQVWLGQEVRTKVRLDGIDTPELRGKCAAESAAAVRARAFLAGAVGEGRVVLRDVRYGKYAGRVLARVMAADGRDLGQALIAERLARPYGGGRRETWCAAG
jgi:endonuclease YncB( thermonuclease family)